MTKEQEKKALALRKQGKNLKEIGKALHKSDKAVSEFLKKAGDKALAKNLKKAAKKTVNKAPAKKTVKCSCSGKCSCKKTILGKDKDVIKLPVTKKDAACSLKKLIAAKDKTDGISVKPKADPDVSLNLTIKNDSCLSTDDMNVIDFAGDFFVNAFHDFVSRVINKASCNKASFKKNSKRR